MNVKLFLIIFGCTAISSCSNHPLPPRTAIVDTRIVELNNGASVTVLTQNAINGDVVEDTDKTLNLVSKSDNAKLVGLKALQFAAMLLSGGSGSVNGHSKEQLKGTHLDNVQNKTMEYLNPEMDNTLKQLNVPDNRKYKITVQPYKFKLIYDGLDSNEYEFIYSTSISVGDFYQNCSSSDLISTERIQPFEKWENNGYELTQILSQKIIKSCFEKINSAEQKSKLTSALLSSK